MLLVRTGLVAAMLALAAAPLASQRRGFAVYISADMEGVAGLSAMDDPLGPKLMTLEVNAAIAGAFAAGATRVVVNDAHGRSNNLLQDQLDPRAILVRGNYRPYGMMEAIDSSFQAVVFIGYHAKARSLGGFSAHTESGAIADLRIGGISVGEGGFNALLAAWYGVPVAFVSGDSLAVVQLQERVPGLTGASVKVGVWNRTVYSLSPDSARAAIHRGVERALRADRLPLVRVPEPVEVDLEYVGSTYAEIVSGIPDLRRSGFATVSFSSPSFRAAYRLLGVLFRFRSLD